MTTNAKFLLGCDPEVFVTKRGKPFSAYGILEGTKDSPFENDFGAYQVDGMAAEFNTTPVAIRDRYNYRLESAFRDWDRRIAFQLKTLKEKLKESGCSIRITPTMEFGKEFLDNQPEEAKELGCDPDYNAYTLKANPRPDGEKTFRTGAGHIHVGWGADIPPENEEHMQICADFVKMLDATVGMFMTYVDRDPLRRELYGKAGAFRPKSYGVEYRTPSNVWIRSRDMRKCIFDLVQLAITKQTEGLKPESLLVNNDYSIEEIINKGMHENALAVVDNLYRNSYLRKFYVRYPDQITVDQCRPVFLKRVINSVEKEYSTNAGK